MTGRRVAVLLALGTALFFLKRHYSDARAEDLRWILWPTSTIVGVLSGTTFEFEPGAGYLSRERLFLIEKSCAGVNFMIAAVGLLGFGLSREVRGWRRATAVVTGSLAVAYVAAVAVNAARIMVAMQLASADLATGWWTDARIHRLEGIAVYFGGLLLLDLAARAFVRARPAAVAR